MNSDLYPPGPAGVPADLTAPTRRYRTQVAVVLLGLFTFVVLYIGLICGSAWSVIYGFNNAMPESPDPQASDNSTWYWALAAVGATLFVFLIKSLFKWHKSKDLMRIEITRLEQPELFEFIGRICADTRAPSPLHIYLTPEVNASVSYNSSILSLFLPVKKNLVIGLGLVNALNLSEFKAVLAHEFGHFSQSTMRVGSYVYVANHIIYDIVYERDDLDKLLDKARRSDFRIAIFAYIITAVLWALRLVLKGAFAGINLLQIALSRQMEFHADLVAVSVSGSDSLIYGLNKLEFANDCQMAAAIDLRFATDRKLYSNDIFYHQTCSQEYVRTATNQPDLGKPPALPADTASTIAVFSQEDEAEASRWSSHPSNFAREQNAKRVYIRSVIDERPAWALFRNPDALRQQLSALFYKHALNVDSIAYTDPEIVQKYIDDERTEISQNDRYHGLYDGRSLSLTLEQIDELSEPAVMNGVSPQMVADAINTLHNATYLSWLTEHRTRRDEIELLQAVQAGQAKLTGGMFEFRNAKHRKSEAKALIEGVIEEIKQDAERFAEFDKTIFQAHLAMARSLDDGSADDLKLRYAFQVQIQGLARDLGQEEEVLEEIFKAISQSQGSLSKERFQQVTSGLADVQSRVRAMYSAAEQMRLPEMNNVEAGVTLGSLLVLEPLLEPFAAANAISGDWLAALAKQVSGMQTRAARLYFKSIGSLLAHQEAIVERYEAAQQNGRPVPSEA